MAHNKVPSRFPRRRTYPHDRTREVFEAAKSGNAVLLDEVLQEMNSSERTSALETKMYFSRREDAYGSNKVTPLIVSVENGNLDCLRVLLKYKADIEGRGEFPDYKDFHLRKSCTPLFVAAAYGNLDILSCLIKNGADVNACTNYNCSPLMAASEMGHANVVTFLIEHGANVDLRDVTGQTALHCAVRQDCESCDVFSHLIKNGADVNARTNEHCTPLIKASTLCNINVVTFLAEHGADLDLQDKYGDTALHCAVIANSSDIVKKLLTLGASQLCDRRRLTPLLLASALCRVSLVDIFISRPNCTKNQRIDALELLGASLLIERCTLDCSQDIWEGFEYINRGMKLRFADPLHPMLKQPIEPVEGYQNRKESQIFQELAQIGGDMTTILMESLVIRERILGRNNTALLGPIRSVADYYDEEVDIFISIGLYKHAMKISQSCNQSAISDLDKLTSLLYKKVWCHIPPRLKDLLELLEQTVLEYEKQQIFTREVGNESHEYQFKPFRGFEFQALYDSALKIVQTIAKFKLCKEGKTSSVSELLKRLSQLIPRDNEGDTLLHKAVGHLLTDTVRLLLNEGFSVNAINNNGDTPLHTAVTTVPSQHGMLDVLLDGGAHHDFVNNDGKTAMDLAKTDEACRILSKKRKLELKCISARAVKKFGLPYLGIVPKTLEKYISMH